MFFSVKRKACLRCPNSLGINISFKWKTSVNGMCSKNLIDCKFCV